MTEQVSKVESFIGYLGQRPLWGVAWAVLVGVLTFMVGTVKDFRDQNALVEQDRAVAARYAEMSAKFDFVAQAINIVMKASLAAARSFQDTVESASDLTTLDEESINRVRMLVRESRGGIDAAKSVFSTLYTYDSDIDSIVEAFRDDLDVVDETLSMREDILEAIFTRDFPSAMTALKFAREDSGDIRGQRLSTFLLRADAFVQVSETKRREHLADLKGRMVRRSNYQLRLYALAPASAYVSGFAVIAVGSWRRQNKSRRKRVVKVASPQDEPDSPGASNQESTESRALVNGPPNSVGRSGS